MLLCGFLVRKSIRVALLSIILFFLSFVQLRATIGDAMCQFYIAEEKDPAMTVSFYNIISPPSPLIPPSIYFMNFLLLQLLSTRARTLSVLKNLQQVCEVGLSREPLYWLVYNALLLTYTLSRIMMKYDYVVISVV